MGVIPIVEMVRFAATRKPQPVNPRELWRDGYDLTRWNIQGGSQNTFPVAHIAKGDWRWIVELARNWIREGLWSKEFGAPIFYFTALVGAFIVALREARIDSDMDAVRDLEIVLQAIWAWETLTAMPNPRSHVTLLLGKPNSDPQVYIGPGESKYYIGPSTATAGDRWNLRSHEQGLSGGPADHDPHGWCLALALAWAGRRDLRPSEGKLRRQDSTPLNAIAHVAGIDRFDQNAHASIFGLSDQLRSVMISAIVNADEQSVREVVEILSKCPPRQGYKRTLTRTDIGIEHIAHNVKTGNKPTVAYTRLQRDGRLLMVRPCRHKGVGANQGMEVIVEGNKIRFGCGEGERAEVDRIEGRVIWRLELNDGRIQLITSQGGDEIIDPVDPVLPHPPEPPINPNPTNPNPNPNPTNPNPNPDSETLEHFISGRSLSSEGYAVIALPEDIWKDSRYWVRWSKKK